MCPQEISMQDKTTKKTSNKRPLVYKPYLKGTLGGASAVKRGLKLLAYYAMFAFLYVLVGSALQFGNTALRVIMNLLMVAVCAAIVYMDGARLGEAEVAFGEIAYARKESGKTVEKKDLERCYHPLKGLFIALIAAIPLWILTVPHAVTAVRQVYSLQSLPKWVAGYSNQAEIWGPLQYYQQSAPLRVIDIFHVIARVLIFPFANIATTDNPGLMLVMDRLSPLLVCLPLLGFPAGYLTGPRSRAMVHGDISSSNKRAQRRKKKAIKARQARTPKKNELI